jgi:uncharacterized damage-inducible protein DinB
MSQVNDESSRQLLLRWMDESWEGGLWAAPWKRALEGLSAEQAAWRPANARKSIWEFVNHMCFWREIELRRLAGETISKEEIHSGNFETLHESGEAAWESSRTRFAQTHQKLREAIADPHSDLARIQYLIPHDSYHIGQIMFLRALQGLPPIE